MRTMLGRSLIVVATMGCGTSAPVPTPISAESVVALVDSFHLAFAAKDTTRLGRLISGDSTMMFYGTSPGEMQRGRAEFLVKHQAQDWVQLDSIRFSPLSDVNTQIATDQAVVTYHTRMSFVAGGQAGSLPLRMTLTLRREEGAWRIRQGSASQIGAD